MRLRQFRRLVPKAAIVGATVFFMVCVHVSSRANQWHHEMLETPSTLRELCSLYPHACQDQTHPVLVKWIQEHRLINTHDPQRPLNFERKPVYGGQVGVPSLVDKVLGNKTNGFYIEAGAFDGEYLTNTILFENKRGWSGLLVEPSVQVFERLEQKNRRAMLLNSCLSTDPVPEMVQFINAGELGRRQDVVSNNLGDLAESFLTTKATEVTCLPIFSVLLALGNPTVDYFSLDVEGSELGVLRTIPWDRIDVRVWSIECNPRFIKKRRLIRFMKAHGYEVAGDVEQDLIFKKRPEL